MSEMPPKQPRDRRRTKAPATSPAFIDITPHRTASPSRLAARDEMQHARLLGMCVAAWAYAEEALTILLAEVLGVDHKRAEIVFYASRSEQFRTDLIRQLMKATSIPTALTDAVGVLLSKFGNLAGKRNSYVHGLWKVDENLHTVVIPAKSGPIDWFAPRNPVTTKDLRDFFDEIEAIEQDLIGILVYVRSALRGTLTKQSLDHFLGKLPPPKPTRARPRSRPRSSRG